ncbi:hypothetical protein TRICHSKD4_3284 [Roseibium sp. TrichSKD4]|nr:hypothetical protein TRICHSKD4_3284 [Roseibium sp. TrichSKD4]
MIAAEGLVLSRGYPGVEQISFVTLAICHFLRGGCLSVA